MFIYKSYILNVNRVSTILSTTYVCYSSLRLKSNNYHMLHGDQLYMVVTKTRLRTGDNLVVNRDTSPAADIERCRG